MILLSLSLLYMIVPAPYFFIEKPAVRYGRMLSNRELKAKKPVNITA